MFKILFGRLKVTKNSDLILLPVKIIYIVYTFPFLIFSLLLYLKGLGTFSGPRSEEITIIKKILVHFSAVVLSFGLWMAILSIIEQKTGFKLRLHLF